MSIKHLAFTLTVITALSIATLMYLHEYHSSTFLQITSLLPQVDLLVHYLRVTVPKWFSTGAKTKVPIIDKGMLFTKEELQIHSDPKNGLYLAILGKVYDVGKGEQFYGPGRSYHFFTGRDASKAFVTGQFTEEGLVDDVSSLNPQELLSLEEWAQFYRKDYKYKGRLIGRYYDANGQPTPYNYKIRKLINRAKNSKEEEHQEKLLYPPCNAEWTKESGSRVWCSTMSGGIERDWVGVPRQLYEPGNKSYRCACVKESELTGPKKGNLKEYPDCNPKSSSCWVYS